MQVEREKYLQAGPYKRSEKRRGHAQSIRMINISSMAAVYSLKYAPEESISVLTRIAKEPGLSGFEAEQAFQRWKEGAWDL